MTRNFRSTETILQAAGQVIAPNHNGHFNRLFSGLTGPAKVTLADLATPEAEAEYLVSRLERLLGGTSHFALYSGRAGGRYDQNGPGLGLADIAVLYRLHALAGPLTEALTRAGLPFQQCGTEPVRETDHLDFQADKISLLTMHAAKGLEFEVVFIIGLEEGLVPYDGFAISPADPQEERRLFYVAMTRAKWHLFLTRAHRRTLYGQRLGSGPSPFLEDIAKELKALDRWPQRKIRPRGVQLDLF